MYTITCSNKSLVSFYLEMCAPMQSTQCLAVLASHHRIQPSPNFSEGSPHLPKQMSERLLRAEGSFSSIASPCDPLACAGRPTCWIVDARLRKHGKSMTDSISGISMPTPSTAVVTKTAQSLSSPERYSDASPSALHSSQLRECMCRMSFCRHLQRGGGSSERRYDVI